MKRLTLLFVTALAVVAFWGLAPAPAYAQDSAAVAVNTKDGSSVFRLAFRIVRVNKEIVDSDNAAVAVASCAECTTVAVAFQAVLIFSDPDAVTTDNIAWAQNYLCTECLTFAYAYQNVFTTDGNVHFTAEANRELAEIRRALMEIGQDLDSIDSWPTPPECEGVPENLLNACKLEARLEPLKQQFAQVLATGLVPSGPPPEEAEEETDSDTSTTPAETTTEAPPETTDTTETAETTTVP